METKREVAAAAGREMLTESAWLKRLVSLEVRAARRPEATLVSSKGEGVRRHGGWQAGACDRPVFVRLRHEDRLLLDARAEARGMRPATYVAVLTRSHLRGLAPLPKDELLALKRCIGELAAIGRNINQIARVANEGGRLPASVREEFRAMLKICEALRDNTKALMKENLTSWESGHG
ncbi:MAG: MobC family plasmid mobilization relaxosome protein [Chloroflexota bacterium]|nr:MobC family plasmid mobilization relaxosome protein [Chloroflexota bacterium]